MTARSRNEAVNHSRRGNLLARNMKQALPAIEAIDTVRRYCFA
jgi:hypothetical protein